MRAVLGGIVLGHLIGAGLAVRAARERGQARALREELVDAIDAVLVDVTRAGRRGQLAREVRHARASACTAAVRGPSATARAPAGAAARASACARGCSAVPRGSAIASSA